MLGYVGMGNEVWVVTVGWKKGTLRVMNAGTTIGIQLDRTKE